MISSDPYRSLRPYFAELPRLSLWLVLVSTCGIGSGAVAGCTSRALPPTVSAVNMDDDDTRTYKVVVNHEEQYSIWLADRENPLGWRDEGKTGTKAACLEHIDRVWTDMRPLSPRRGMEADRENSDVGAD